MADCWRTGGARFRHIQISLQLTTTGERKPNFVRGKTNTIDIEFQHHFAIGKRNDIVWGVDYRAIGIDTAGGISLQLDSPAVAEESCEWFCAG